MSRLRRYVCRPASWIDEVRRGTRLVEVRVPQARRRDEYAPPPSRLGRVDAVAPLIQPGARSV